MGRRRKKVKPLPQEQQRAGDRISSLPDGIVVHILSFLDTRDAVRTSVLSRRWKLLWMHVPNLFFNLRHGSLDKPQMRSLYGTIFHHAAPKILKFSLHLDGDWPLRRVNRLVRFTAKRHVEELVLCLTAMYRCILPDCIFSHESLRNLRLFGCTVKPPERVSWGSLRVLCVELGDLEDIEKVLSGCPSLESLLLHNVRLAGRANIVHNKMKTLLIDHVYKDCQKEPEVCVNAPRLEELVLLGNWQGISFKLIDVPSLVYVHLGFYWIVDDVNTDPRKEIFQMVGHSKNLWLGWHFLQFLSDQEMIKLCPTLYSRECLFLKLEVSLGDLERWILGMFYLLHGSTNLARLIIDFQDSDCYRRLSPTNDGIACRVVSPTSNGFAYTPKDGPEDRMSITKTDRFLSNVKTVEIHGIVYKEQWFTFVEMLLKHAVVLEEMIIFSKSSKKSLPQMAETLLNLRRSFPRVMVSLQEKVRKR